MQTSIANLRDRDQDQHRDVDQKCQSMPMGWDWDPWWMSTEPIQSLRTVQSIGGSKGGRQERAPPWGAQILSFSCSFRQKKLKSNRTFGRWRTLPWENSESATAVIWHLLQPPRSQNRLFKKQICHSTFSRILLNPGRLMFSFVLWWKGILSFGMKIFFNLTGVIPS